MTKTRVRLLVVAGLTMAYGLPSVIGAFLVDDATPIFRFTSFVVGTLLVVGAALLVLEKSWAIPAIWLSFAIYAAAVLVPAFYWHGLGAFSVLMGAFYASLVMRLCLAVGAHILVRRVHG